jgi:hypothetical protein
MAPITDQGASERAKQPPNTTKGTEKASTQRNKAIGTLQHRIVSENASENGPKHAKIHQSTADAKSTESALNQDANSTQRRGLPNLWWDRTEEEHEAAASSSPRESMENSSETSNASTDSEMQDARDGSPDALGPTTNRLCDTYKPSHIRKLVPMLKAPRQLGQTSMQTSADREFATSTPCSHIDVAEPIKITASFESEGLSWADRSNNPAQDSFKQYEPMVIITTSPEIHNAIDQLKAIKTGPGTEIDASINTVINMLVETHSRAIKQESVERENRIEIRRLRREIRTPSLSSGSISTPTPTSTPTKDQTAADTLMREMREFKESIAKEISGIKDNITEAIANIQPTSGPAPAPRTWSSVVASPTPAAVEAARQRQAQAQRTREARQQTEVIINLEDITTAIGNQLNSTRDNEGLLKYIQNQINGPLRATRKNAKIVSAARTSKYLLRLTCHTPEDAETIKTLEWPIIIDGAKIHAPTYGIVVHGVSKADLDPAKQKEAIETIITSNSTIEDLKVTRVTPLMRKARNEAAPTQSIVLFVPDIDHAVKLTEEGIRIGYKHHQGVKYAPQTQIKRCFKCQDFGHKAMGCTRPTKCSKCGGDHDTRECVSTESKCANCGDANHRAWHRECPRQQKELERLRLVRASISPVFARPSP